MPDVHDHPLLADLTDPQRDAVLCTEGPLLVLAAAGSGKTRVITRRIAYLVHQGVRPWSILALTFTNKAAGEMKRRVLDLLGDESAASGLTVTTFHALCARLLRRYAEQASLPGVAPDFTIADSADQVDLLKRVMADIDLSVTHFPPRGVLGTISRAKTRGLDADAFSKQTYDFHGRQVAQAFKAYERALRAANALDFDDLLLHTAAMLRDRAEIRAQCQARWRYFLIDEYQDTNTTQFEIARLIAGAAAPDAGPNICVVGDPDQSIYGWRGADIANILDFEATYPTARVIALGENFRSTAPILAVADSLIKNNVQRKHKPLFTRSPGGEPVEVRICRNEHHEAELVRDWLRDRHIAGAPWRDLAVLYRNNALSRVIEDTLRKAGIPYVIARGTAFYQREEVKTALAYLRVVANPADDVSLRRIINTPARGIGDATLTHVQSWASTQDVSLHTALRDPGALEALAPRARNAIDAFVQLVECWSAHGAFMGDEHPGLLAELVARILRESGLTDMYAAQARKNPIESGEARVANLDEIVSAAADFQRTFDPAADPLGNVPSEGPPSEPSLRVMLQAYLEHVALVADADAVDPDRGAVTLMTLHAAKGLEFTGVAIVGLEEGLLPSLRRADDQDVEEERRLAFVGMTRAMRHLLLTSAAVRTVRGQPTCSTASRFLGELDLSHIDLRDESDSSSWPSHGDVDSDPDFDRPPSRGDSPFRRGQHILHPQLGFGEVLDVEHGAQTRLRIRFRDSGMRTIIAGYVPLKILT